MGSAHILPEMNIRPRFNENVQKVQKIWNRQESVTDQLTEGGLKNRRMMTIPIILSPLRGGGSKSDTIHVLWMTVQQKHGYIISSPSFLHRYAKNKT